MRATPVPAASRGQVRGRSQNRCERCGTPCQTGHWHHRRSRSVRDEHTHHACNGLWLCTTCHLWVHANPMAARAGGFILPRVAALPEQYPVQTPWGLRLHRCNGMYDLAPINETEQP